LKDINILLFSKIFASATFSSQTAENYNFSKVEVI